MIAIPFKPKVGKRASLYIPKEDRFLDVEVLEVRRRGQEYVVQSEAENRKIVCRLTDLERPIDAGVNERFEFYEELTRLTVTQQLNALLVVGEGGIGKDHTVDSILGSEELEEEVDFVRVKGHCSPLALYNLLKENHDKLIIFSDCDSVLDNETSANVLKAVLDSYSRRVVKWLSTRSGASTKTFEFTGSVIFLSNKAKNSIDSALLSRSVIIDLYMSNAEKIERMEYILPTLDVGKSLSIAEKTEVLQLLDKYKNTIDNLNLRTLIKGVLVYEKTRNLDLVRYQILNG